MGIEVADDLIVDVEVGVNVRKVGGTECTDASFGVCVTCMVKGDSDIVSVGDKRGCGVKLIARDG